jgi:hypothetical protein
VAFEADIDVSCAACRTPRAALHPLLLLLPVGLLLLASSRCGELARA